MVTYKPIPLDEELQLAVADLDRLCWTQRALVADFAVNRDDPRRVRVQFPHVLVTRVLDDAHWSTEDEGAKGFVQGHFAYEVEGARFWKAQSPLITQPLRGAVLRHKHYAFVTGWTCLDVIAEMAPSFSLIDVAGG